MRSSNKRGIFRLSVFSCLVIAATFFGLQHSFADTVPFEITDVVVSDISATATGGVTGYEGNHINNNVVFHKVGDSVTYKINIKNVSNTARVIENVSSNYEGELFAYEFNSYAGDTVEAGDSFDFVLKTTYTNAVSDVTKRNQNLEIKFVFIFSDGSEMTIVIANPSTWDNISVFGIVLAVSVIGLLALIIFRMKRVDPSKKVVMIGILLAIACLPLPFVNATDGVYDVVVANSFELHDELAINYTSDEGEIESTVVKYGELAEVPVAPEKEGYHFVGWETEDGELFDFSTPISDDVELSAVFAPNDYAVSFNGNGATSGEMPLQTLTYDEVKNLYSNRFAKFEYDFVGWNTKADGTGDKINDGAEVLNLVSNGSITLYAQWTPSTYAVIFNNNGGSGEMSAQKITKGTLQKLTKSSFTKEDYAFWYWNTKADGTGARYEDEQAVRDLVPLGQTIELFAIYSRERYEHPGDISFDGSNYVDTDVYLFNERNIGRDFIISFKIKERNTGETLSTIMNSMSEVGNPYPGLVYRVADNNNAKFVANTTAGVKFERSYSFASGANDVVIKRIGNSLYLSLGGSADDKVIDLSSLTTPFSVPTTFGASLDGNKNPWRYFIGTLSDLRVELLDNNEHGAIKYIANGGVGNMETQDTVVDQVVKLRNNSFTRVGYKFDRWNTKADGSGNSYTNQQVIDAPTGELILFAQWSTYNYKVAFNANGGSGSMPIQSFVSNVAQNLNESQFTKEGYSFAFWNTKADGTGKVYQDKEEVAVLSTAPNGTVTLYAIYETDNFEKLGDTVFDGTEYINTNMYLFSEKNIHRDFELSFTVKNVNDVDKFDTVSSSMDETGKPWPGFVFRVSSKDNNNFEIAANSSTGNEVMKSYSIDTSSHILIRRTNGVLYLKINDGAEEQIINYSTIVKYFYSPLTIGASLNGNLKPQRQFKGTLSDIKVRFLN